MKTSIVILTHNQQEYLQRCIESIRNYTESGQYEIIVVDNNSDDGTVQWLKTQQEVATIYNDQNVGLPAGYNQAIRLADGDTVLLLKQDAVVTQGWLCNLLACLYSHEKIGAVAPVTNIAPYYQAVWGGYNNMEEMQVYAKSHNQSAPGKWEERVKLAGYCMLIKKEVIDKVGLFDEAFTPGGMEDDDYSFRIRLAGYTLFLCKDTFIHNSGQVLSHTDNRSKFAAKWGFDSIYSTYIRNEIVNLIDKPKDQPIKVLEVGCACGGTLLQIKNIYAKAELAGIEFNEQAAASAGLFADVIAADIEKATLPYPEGYFDYIIFADVLEHLVDPWQALKNVEPYLQAGGRILASIPNVMHVSVIQSLLQGYWRYVDAGILDKTHMRFFTLSEINRMFTNTGYQLAGYHQTYIHESETDKHFIQALTALMGNPQLAAQYRTYQYIVTAAKANGGGALPAG